MVERVGGEEGGGGGGCVFFFFNDTATTEIYTLSLHDALPIYLATTTGPASVSGNLEFSTDGGTTWTPITTTEIETDSVPVNGTVQVRVPVEVTAGATAGTPITVKLGDRKSTRLNSSHPSRSRMPSSA